MSEASPPNPIVLPSVGDDATVAEVPLGGFSPIWIWLACLALAFIAMEPALHGDAFIWTDKDLIRDNSFLNRLAGLALLWTGITHPGSYPLPQYSPLAQTTFFIDQLIWGDRAWGMRITSTLLHATCGLVLFQLLRNLRVRGAAIAALLFVAHPLAVESVAWLSERRNVIATLLGLSSMYLALRAARAIAPPPADAKFKPLPPEPGRLLALAAILQVVALFASPIVAFLPGVTLLLTWWRRRGRVEGRLIGACAALMVAGLTMLFINGTVERASVAMSDWRRDITPIGDFATRVQLAARGVITYAARTVVPHPLVIDPARPMTPADAFYLTTRGGSALVAGGTDVGPGVLTAWLAPLLVIGLLYAAWRFRGRVGRSPFLVGAAFVLCLLPSLGFVSLGWMRYSFVADRAAYLALAPLVAGIVAGIVPLLRTTALRNAGLAVAALAVIALVVGSRASAGRFENELQFWRTTLAINPQSLAAVEQLVQAELFSRDTDYTEVDRLIETGLKSHPREPSLLRLNAVALRRNGLLDDALTVLRGVLNRDPNYAAAYSTLGDIFRSKADQNPNAPDPRIMSRDAYARAAELNRTDERSRLWMADANAEILRRIGPEHPEAEPLMKRTLIAIDEATQLRPYHVDTLLFAARQLLLLGRVADASTQIQVARSIEPDNVEALVLLGEAYFKSGNPQPAESSLNEALKLNPNSLRALLKLGELRQAQERWDEAAQPLARALALSPNLAEAQARLADIEARRQTIWPPMPTTMPTSQPADAP